MKKILATLLVATMLLSCMSVIGFAAESNLYTDEVYATKSIITYQKTSRAFNYTDPAGKAYYETLNAIEGAEMEKDPDFVLPDTLYADMWAAKDAKDATLLPSEDSFPYAFVSGDYVALPLYADGTGIVDGGIYVKYDANYFEFASVSDLPGPIFNTNKKPGYLFATWTNGADGKVEGYLGSIFFKVKDITGIDGDVNGNAVGTFTISLEDDGALNNGAAALGEQVTCSVNLTGLKATTAPSKENATVEDLAAAVEFTGEVAADSFAQIPASQIVSGDGEVYNYNAHGDYRIFFGKFVDDTFNQPTAQGFVIEGGKETVKATAKTEFKAGEPFGILVFGMGAQTKLTATPFIEY